MKPFFLISFFCFSLFLNAQTPRDFSFLTGSCAYISPKQGDTSYYLYRGDTSIFYAMAKKEANFILWLGDNWYLDKADWSSKEGLEKKADYARTVKTVQPLIEKNIPEYAIWDDHDYGPDQGQQDYPLKYESRRVFINTWKNNPGFGEEGEGVYTSFKKEDVLFILLDNRWWRDRDNLWDYKWFKPNPRKRMFGKKQMKWLKEQLLQDTSAAFKIIVAGSQMLNPWAKGDGFRHFPVEYYELLDFISHEKISGVLFLTGDRHFSEIIRLPRSGQYPLYDITVSPLTSTPDRVKGIEKKNKYRLPGSLTEDYNFASISVSGEPRNRKLKITYFNTQGNPVYEWEVSAKELF